VFCLGGGGGRKGEGSLMGSLLVHAPFHRKRRGLFSRGERGGGNHLGGVLPYHYTIERIFALQRERRTGLSGERHGGLVLKR